MRREKISPAIKRKTVTELETGRLSQGEAAKRLNVGKATIQGWLSKYRSEGSSSLESNSENRIYSVQAKQQAVEAYLTGKYSQQRICEIFKIRDRRQLRNWLKVYKESAQELRTAAKGHFRILQGLGCAQQAVFAMWLATCPACRNLYRVWHKFCCIVK